MPGSTTNMGLVTWTLLTDFFSHTDLVNNWSKVDGHDHVPVGSGGNGGAPIPAAGIQNGAVTNAKLAANAVNTSNIVDNAVTSAKIADGAITPSKISSARGVSVISATETRNNTAFGLMTTPDQVTGVVLPTNGLIAIAYQATWQESVPDAGRAAIFIGANQLTVATDLAAAPQAQAARSGTVGAGLDGPLFTIPAGLATGPDAGYTGDLTTGQALGYAQSASNASRLSFDVGGALMRDGTIYHQAGGPCYAFAAAGTYTVSVQFKATSGTVTAKNRKLWVWAITF